MNLLEKNINELEYLLKHDELLTKEFIKRYIVHFIHDHNLKDSLERIYFNDKRCGYDEDHKRIFIKTNFTHKKEREILNRCNEKEQIFLYNLCNLFMLNHELGHVIQKHNKDNEIYSDNLFKKEIQKSEDICELDKIELNGQNYEKFYEFFLFEVNANMIAMLQNEEILKYLSDTYPKELYNEFVAIMITTAYYDDIYPIDFSNRVYNKIVEELKEKDNKKYSALEIIKTQALEIPTNYSLQELLLNGYPIPKENYEHFIDIRDKKVKVKSLFN